MQEDEIYEIALNIVLGGLVFIIVYLTVKYKADAAKEGRETDERWHWAIGAVALVIVGLVTGVFAEALGSIPTVNGVPQVPTITGQGIHDVSDVFMLFLGPYTNVAPTGTAIGSVGGLVAGLWKRHQADVL